MDRLDCGGRSRWLGTPAFCSSGFVRLAVFSLGESRENQSIDQHVLDKRSIEAFQASYWRHRAVATKLWC